MIDIALVHHPVVNKNGEPVTTSVTNIDLHDIARSCRTFGVRTFWVVTPVAAMHALTERILRHWHEGWGATYNPNRGDALRTIRLAHTLEEAIAGARAGASDSAQIDALRVVATSARAGVATTVALEDAAAAPRLLLVFGTGGGLAAEALALCEGVLPPIVGPSDYNHLSVRAAVAIYLHELCRVRLALSD